jgi:signal transduction histidine kinase
MSRSTTFTHWTELSKRALSPDLSSRVPRLLAAALAALIFVLDTFTPLHVAVAVMYVVVVLLSASFAERQGILLWGASCVALVLVSFLLSHGSFVTENGVGRILTSMLAIGTTTFLAMRMRSASDALRRSEGYLIDAQKLSQTGSFALDMVKGTYVWSDETYSIFEYERPVTPTIELMRERIHPDDLHAWDESMTSRRKSLINVDIQYRLLFPGGRVKYIHALTHPVKLPGRDPEYIGALMDITAAKQAEDELHEAHAALAHVTRVTTLGELMASIAHEVNQPLAGIVTNGEACMRWLARDVPNLDEARSAVERMIGDGRRASGIIRKLRALSRKDGLRKTPLNLNDVINDTIPLVRRELFNNRVVLRLSLAQGLPVVMGDKVQLQQVVLNLTVNAIQAMSQIGTRARTLSVRSEPYGETGVCVTVSDSGDGIDPENTDRLFNAFFTTKDGGMGMGLSICRSIVEDHGGRIWGANNDAPGATFGFILEREEEARGDDAFPQLEGS